MRLEPHLVFDASAMASCPEGTLVGTKVTPFEISTETSKFDIGHSLFDIHPPGSRSVSSVTPWFSMRLYRVVDTQQCSSAAATVILAAETES